MAPSFRLLFLLCNSLCFCSYAATTTFPKDALPTKSGYLPVNTTSGSALFYIFYEAQKPISPLPTTPLLIWLNGGPGCSSMIGNFFELGPWFVKNTSSSLNLRRNPAAWNHQFSLLFIDNPIGTGFSTAATKAEIPSDENAVADHLFTAIQLFLSSESSFRTRPLYITGESYAGKYIPAIAYHILRKNILMPASIRINLQGIAIGDGLTHPIAQVDTHAETAHAIGLINMKQKRELEVLQNDAVRLTEEQRWAEAASARKKVLDWLQNVTGLATLYDFTKHKPYDTEKVDIFLNSNEVKAALGVSNNTVWEECSETVGVILHSDVMKSAKFMVEYVVERTRVLLYQGQYDLRDGVASTEAWMKEMKWAGLQSFLEAERKVWRIASVVAGYVQTSRNLSHVVVSGAGHLVPADQGPSAQAMIEDWVLQDGLFREQRPTRS